MIIASNIDFDTAYRRRVLSGILEFCVSRPDTKLYFPGTNCFNQVPPEHVDGILTVPGPSNESLVEFLRPGLPIVTIGSTQHPAAVNVIMDDLAVARLWLEHLMECNARGLAYVHVRGSAVSTKRLACFSQVCRESGITLHVIEFTMRQIRVGLQNLADVLDSFPKPTGVVVATDDHAVEFVRLCNRGGHDVPEDYLVIGAGNNIDQCLSCTPAISSIEVGSERFGYEAANALMAMIRGESVPAQILIPPRYVVARESTRRIDRYSPEVFKALNFMDANLEVDIQMEDLLAEQNVSRRTFENLFANDVGESPMKHLRSLRLKRIRFMLRTTNLPVVEIGRRCGIPDPSYLGLLFRRTYGMTPLNFRRGQSG